MTSIAVDCVDGVGHLQLNRANALNALDLQFCTEIDDALLALDAREEVRAILISTSLKHFCAGADIREMLDMSAEQASATGFIGCVSAPPRLRKPLIVAVRGLAAGGGCELVEMCDIVLAAASARFCHPEITLGAMPGAGGTQRLARVVGKHVALDLLLTGRALSADEALSAGLVSRVLPDEELEAAAMSVARLVASYSSPVACRIKAAVNGAQVGLDAGLAMERALFHACFSEHDFREGLAAFWRSGSRDSSIVEGSKAGRRSRAAWRRCGGSIIAVRFRPGAPARAGKMRFCPPAPRCPPPPRPRAAPNSSPPPAPWT